METNQLINEIETFVISIINGTYENVICEKLKEIFGVGEIVFEREKPQTYMYLIRGNEVWELLVYCPSPIPKLYYNYEIFEEFKDIIQKERATIEKLMMLYIKIDKIRKCLLNK